MTVMQWIEVWVSELSALDSDNLSEVEAEIQRIKDEMEVALLLVQNELTRDN